jgi:peptidoglycan hydrolase CwlO-like protein
MYSDVNGIMNKAMNHPYLEDSTEGCIQSMARDSEVLNVVLANIYDSLTEFGKSQEYVAEEVSSLNNSINGIKESIESLEYTLIALLDKDGEVMKQKIKRDLEIMQAQQRAP